MEKKAQQEMVGFVLIVVLVVIGMMVFLILSIRDKPSEVNNVEVDNLLNSVMKYTTECATSFEPDYDNFEDLFKSCYKNDQCDNLKKGACDYLEESLGNVMQDLLKSEADVEYYSFEFFVREDEGNEGILKIDGGNCSSKNILGSQKSLISGGTSLVVRMELCNG